MLERITIDLGGARVEEARLVNVSQLEQPASALAVDAQGLDRRARVAGRAGGARQVIDPVELRKRRQLVDDIVLDEGEPRVLLQGLDVLEPTRDEIVHAVDRVTARQELFAQVRPQHARTTGDDDAHDSSSLNTHRRGAEGPPRVSNERIPTMVRPARPVREVCCGARGSRHASGWASTDSRYTAGRLPSRDANPPSVTQR